MPLRRDGELEDRAVHGSSPPRTGASTRCAWAGQMAVGVVLLLATGLLTAQLLTERNIRRTVGVGSPRLQEIAYRLQRSEAARQRLEQQVTALREQVAGLARAVAEDEVSLRRRTAELDRLRMLAGLTPVSGPGVVVEVQDSPRQPGPAEDPNDGLVHYTDLQAIINDLFAGGAEAVAVNGERFTVASAVQCVGTTVLLNGKRLAVPFRLEAIGDDAALQAFVTRPAGAVRTLQAFGFPVAVSRTRLVLPPYRGTFPLAEMAAP